MTQEEKQLLLKDLCARLPYGIRYKGDGGWGINPHQHTTSLCTILTSEEPLIYLRPMSSMTEEELSFYNNYLITPGITILEENLSEYLDWIHSHHFDYRGLIERGLALEAPEGMYKND